MLVKFDSSSEGKIGVRWIQKKQQRRQQKGEEEENSTSQLISIE